MFGFMLDETEARDDSRTSPSCKVCYLRLAPRDAQVVSGEVTYHRDCFESAHVKRTGQRPRLVRAATPGGNGHTFRLAA